MEGYDAKKDAEAHWKYSEMIAILAGASEEAIRLSEYFYIQAFIHGSKHEREWRESHGEQEG